MDEVVSLLDTKHGLSGLLLSIVAIGLFQILIKIWEFVWTVKKEKDKISEEGLKKLTQSMDNNTAAVMKLQGEFEKLENEIKRLEGTMAEIPKVKTDLRRLFMAVKSIAGDKWVEIRREMMSDDGLI